MMLARQRGLSMGGWFMVVVIVLGLASVVVRVAPYYIDNNTIVTIVQETLDGPNIGRFTVSQIHEDIKKRLKLNNIREFDTREAMEIEKRSGNVIVDMNYEIREPLFYNIDVVLKFEQHFEKVLR